VTVDTSGGSSALAELESLARQCSLGRMAKSKSPPEKKALSYARDRRNAYGENSKSSRKSVATRKALVNRANRAIARTALATAKWDAEGAESKLLRKRRKRWAKAPNEPLASAVVHKLERRRRLKIDAPQVSRSKVARVARKVRRRS
jgi:hypothetical protein